MYQQVMIIGNVGREPELSYTPQGIAVAKFTVAVNKVTGKGETRKEKTTWFRVSVWRERAETANQYIRKGAKIMVIGEVDANPYIDRDGNAQATLELTASDFKFLDSREEQSQPQGAGANNQSAPQGKGQTTRYENPNDIPF